MSHKALLGIGSAALIGIAAFVVWGMTAPSAVAPHDGSDAGNDSGIVYYYGEECSHCHELSKFLEDNKIAGKVSFVKKEIWHDRKNAREMDGRADRCNIAKKERGVPFIWADGKCFVGGPDAEKFFKERAGMSGSGT